MSNDRGELILYRTEDGRTDIHLRAIDGTVSLTQREMAELFETTSQNISTKDCRLPGNRQVP